MFHRRRCVTPDVIATDAISSSSREQSRKNCARRANEEREINWSKHRWEINYAWSETIEIQWIALAEIPSNGINCSEHKILLFIYWKLVQWPELKFTISCRRLRFLFSFFASLAALAVTVVHSCCISLGVEWNWKHKFLYFARCQV